MHWEVDIFEKGIITLCSLHSFVGFCQYFTCRHILEDVLVTLEEETHISGIIEKAKEKSEGTNIRLGADRENDTEYAYEQFLSISPDGTPMEPTDDIEYEDIGLYYWAVGIPDDQSISKDEAWEILLKFLIDQKLSTPEDLVHYYPLISFETGNYSGNPVWRIILECYDNAESNLPFTFCDVAIYAHDGSICGYRLIEPVG